MDLLLNAALRGAREGLHGPVTVVIDDAAACARCAREVPENLAALVLHACALCGRTCCDRCLRIVRAPRPDGLPAGTYCKTCMGKGESR